ncbi:MAG: Serine/threonine protein kinase [Myxococcaceae bacterium]|nr:Serine/threonine protein kinase [Myxococcaceae bacterium]
MIGTTIAGKYLVKRRIGSGGMGAVYEGEHVEIGKRVAIKVIEHEHARSTELAARFRREARAASAVESEHIVQVFDVGQDDAVGLYMVMELLVGEDLSSRLEKGGGKIPVDEAVTIATQAARALGKAHAAGVVHRDLKPANLFLTEREDGSVSVKILDFGISKLVRPEHDAKSSTLTREGSVMGTPMYMSPEQAQGLPVDARSDVWSLASVLYEALAGRTAYDARDTYEQMIVQIVTQKPRPIEEVAPWVPAAIARVIESALTHDVATRMPDASSFAKKLAEAARMAPTASNPDLGALAPPPSDRHDDGRSDGRVAARASSGAASPPTGTGVVVGARTEYEAALPPKRSAALWLALAAAAVGGVIVVAVMTRGPSTTPPAGGGLVASTAEASASPSASPAPSPAAAAVSTTRLQPLGSSLAETGDVPPAPSATAATKTTTAIAADAGARPAGRPVAGTGAAPTATTTSTTKPGTTQYGAAGVSTAY